MHHKLKNTVMTKGVARLSGSNDNFSAFMTKSLKQYMENVSTIGLFFHYKDDRFPGISIVREAHPFPRITVMLAGEY